MTKPREKTREELTAEIEDGKKKIWQLENREKMLRHDESVNRLREQVAALARAVEPEMTIHDFRVTKGPQHTNLIFDVVVPHRCRLRDEELCERLSGAVRALDERYFAVIQVDRAYVETR